MSFIDSAFTTRREYEASLLLPPAERAQAEAAAAKKVDISAHTFGLSGSLTLRDGRTVPVAEALKGKKSVALYFSGHWCGPCRGFTPTLVSAYDAYMSAGGTDLEIVFVSSDRDSAAAESYHSEMPWPTIAYEDPQRTSLKNQFKVNGIPALVALSPEGNVVLLPKGMSCRGLVDTRGAAAFPFTAAHYSELERDAQRELASALSSFGSLTGLRPPTHPSGELVTALQEEDSISALLEQNDTVALLFGDGDGSDATYAKVAQVQAQVRADHGADALTVVYIGWSLYNAESDHTPLAAAHHALLEFSDDTRSMLASLAGGTPSTCHLVVLRRGSHGLCKMDGTCAPAGAPELIANDPGAGRLIKRGVAGYPWSDTTISKLENEDKARVQRLKECPGLRMFDAGDRFGSGSLLHGELGAVSVSDVSSRLDPETVLGLYFSAHWCGPCR